MAVSFIRPRLSTRLLGVLLLLGGTSCGQLKQRLAETTRTLTARLLRHYDADQPAPRFNPFSLHS